MRLLAAETIAWLLAISGFAAAVRAGSVALVVPDDAKAAVVAASDHPAPSRSLDSAAQFVIARDLFRLGRRPGSGRYNPALLQQPNVPSTAARPQLVLRGVVVSDTASALIEGFPGLDGARLLRIGDSMAGIKVIAISRSQIRVAGRDTTWTVPLRRQP